MLFLLAVIHPACVLKIIGLLSIKIYLSTRSLNMSVV
jgi:hypothetical protein